MKVRLLVSSLTNGIMTVPTSFPRAVGTQTWDNGCKEFSNVPGAEQALGNQEPVLFRSIIRCPALFWMLAHLWWEPSHCLLRQPKPLSGSSNRHKAFLYFELKARQLLDTTLYADTELKPSTPSQTLKGPMTVVMFSAHLFSSLNVPPVLQVPHHPLSSGHVLTCPSPSKCAPELLPGLKGQSGRQRGPISEDNITIYHIIHTMHY